MALDPHVSRFLDMMALGSSNGIDLAARREGLRGLARLAAAGLATGPVTVRDITVPGPGGALSLRLYTPEGEEPGPGLVFLHGGGLVTGDLDTHDALCRTLCDAGRMRVVAVAYRLAPEHPFPAALEDALAATRWVMEHADEVGIDPARLAVGGESAGAGLAARICQELRETGQRPAAQLLICPVLDLHGMGASRRDFARGYFLDEATIQGDRRAFVKQTGEFDNREEQIEFATQSGPMLVVDGSINAQFKPDSNNINIRNGVCVTENGAIFFSISRREVNFYNFAEHFRQAGCRDALYLDGFVSRMYLPEKGVEQIDGDFGVIIGVVE
jgi:acetyl esterase/lipase